MMQTDMGRDYNAEQRRVITATGGCHLVLAPPGCGKTAVLAERIVWAHAHGVDFADMACLTFTNRASKGMRERVSERLRQEGGPIADEAPLQRLFIGNVHRFCSHFLFDSGVVADHAAVIDTDTSISIISDYLGEDELRVQADGRQRQRYAQIINLQHLMYQCEHHYPAELMVHRDALKPAALRELCVAFALPYTQASSIALYRHADTYRDDTAVLLSADARQLLGQLYAARQYEDYKRRNDLLDFEDLLLYTYDALTAADGPAGYRKFSWLQIDEVQDLNPLQLAIIDRFTAPGATVVCLGDAQQAIFSFMGAKTDTLAALRRRCGDGCFHNFFQNYRSPRYLLDVFNTYGAQQLHIDPELLPSTSNHTPQQPGDLQLIGSETSVDEANRVARLVDHLYAQHPEETIAVVVATNSDADSVSAALGRLPHFKISGTDFLATPPMRLLLAHLSVVAMEHNFIAWSQIYTGLQVFSSNSAARQFVRAMMQLGLSATDFIDYDRTTYVGEFVKAYESTDVVVFDTETTGLDIFADDVVQIAAVKTRRGRVVDELNLFMETSRPIPPMLGNIVNPLVEEYARQPHLRREEAFARFFDFAKGCTLVGHNVNFDWQILTNNIDRLTQKPGNSGPRPTFDTLKLARLLRPRLASYKLRDLLSTLGLEGENSHLANDDILATLSLMTYCFERGRSLVGRQLEFASRHRTTIDRFRNLYADLYRHARSRLYERADAPVLADELLYAHDSLRELNRQPADMAKLGYVLDYIRKDLLADGSEHCLAEQLHRYMPDLATLKEADLCGSKSMTERVFVSTVHKAKGLEFDNVVVYDAVAGKYPSVFATTEAEAEEEARKFYVAISRARRRLMVTYCDWAIGRWGARHQKELTPYMRCLLPLFARG